ncbi:hypothetical protein HW555_012310 [Spodoptera exigua]|uniref:Uncharacterized protein n=1 Tax=Spodoptera exigua TaxID=7107 RepID=A0A835G5F4_SPOEX|nr:hypothetical protein HW555_012310 [Spodoptera exigua]
MCKALKDKFEARNVSEVEKSRHVEDFMVQYMVATDNLDGTRNVMRTKMIATSFCEFSRCIIAVYYTNYSLAPNPMKNIIWFLELSLSGFAMAAPMMLMESTENYLEETKILLTGELLTYKDNILRNTVYDALDYIDNNISSRYTIWNGFPANLSFVISFFNITISYIIATLQFLY